MSQLDLNISADPISLKVWSEDCVLVLNATEQKIQLGIACPEGLGEPNAAANVGGQEEVFRDAIAGILNFRTLQGLSGVSVVENGDVIEISGAAPGSAHRESDQLVHAISEDSFEELEYTGSRVDAIRVYTDASKTTKIREEEFSYTGPLVTQIVTKQYDAGGTLIVGETMTEDFNYTGSKLDDIDRTVT